MSSHSNQMKGTIYMLLAAFFFSTGGLALKFIPWHPLAINALRSILGAAVLLIFCKLTKHNLQWNRTVILGAFSYMMVTSLFIVANQLTTAAGAIVLQFTAPIWIVILSAIFLHKKPAGYELVTIAAAAAGILCFFASGLKNGSLAGDLAALVSGIFYGVLFMINSLEGGDALSSVFFGQVLSALALGVFIPRIGSVSPVSLGALLWLGIFQVGVSYVFFSLGTDLISPLQASLINGIEPVLNPVLVAVFYHEVLTPLSLLGAAIVLISILASSIYGLKHPASA